MNRTLIKRALTCAIVVDFCVGILLY